MLKKKCKHKKKIISKKKNQNNQKVTLTFLKVMLNKIHQKITNN